MLGVFTKPVSLNALELTLKEVRIVGSITYGSPGHRSDFTEAVGIVEKRAADLDCLVTARLPLERVGEGFELATDKARGSIKVSIEP